VITSLEGEEDTVSAGGILTTSIALLVVVRVGAFINLSGNVMPVDFVEGRRKMRDRIAIMSHSPAGLELTLKPRRENLITYTRGAECGKLDSRSRGVGGVDEGKIGGSMSGQCASQ
jgi:hypothetical protein